MQINYLQIRTTGHTGVDWTKNISWSRREIQRFQLILVRVNGRASLSGCHKISLNPVPSKYLKRYSGCGDSRLWADKWFDLYITWSWCVLPGRCDRWEKCLLFICHFRGITPNLTPPNSNTCISSDLPTCRQPKPNLQRKPFQCKLELSQMTFETNYDSFLWNLNEPRTSLSCLIFWQGSPDDERGELYAYLAAAAVVSFSSIGLWSWMRRQCQGTFRILDSRAMLIVNSTSCEQCWNASPFWLF